MNQHKCRCERLEFGSCQDVMSAICVKLMLPAQWPPVSGHGSSESERWCQRVGEAPEIVRCHVFTSPVGKRRQRKNQTSYQPLWECQPKIFCLPLPDAQQRDSIGQHTWIGNPAFLVAWPLIHDLISLGLGFVVCWMEIILPGPYCQDSGEDKFSTWRHDG